MDSFEFNKIAGAVLGTALGVMALSIVAEAVFAPSEPAKPGMEVAIAEGGGAEGGGEAKGPEVTPIAVRLQTADAAKGEASAKVCAACHSFGEGEPAKAGPNLYNVVGGPTAHMAGYKYSDAMTKRHDEGINWTFEELDHFLANPKGYVPGTAMGFAGLKKPEQRADVIAYLRSLSANPVPLPTPEAAPASADSAAAPADTAAPADNSMAPADSAAPADTAPAPADTTAPAAPADTTAPAPTDNTMAPADTTPPADSTAPADTTAPSGG